MRRITKMFDSQSPLRELLLLVYTVEMFQTIN